MYARGHVTNSRMAKRLETAAVFLAVFLKDAHNFQSKQTEEQNTADQHWVPYL